MSREEFAHMADDIELGDFLDPQPWERPGFGTLDNFVFAEFALDAELNDRQVKAILDLINRVREGISTLTFTSNAQLKAAWATASHSQAMVLTLHRPDLVSDS